MPTGLHAAALSAYGGGAFDLSTCAQLDLCGCVTQGSTLQAVSYADLRSLGSQKTKHQFPVDPWFCHSNYHVPQQMEAAQVTRPQSDIELCVGPRTTSLRVVDETANMNLLKLL